MKNIIIGTAGHVDHGKTSLIRALTGIETDRLREEQERGMSIELGFAHFTLPSGARAGIVDVPGHERFIKNMLMGATGMDMVVLVIAADEGVMPQTREHFAILRLLGVRAGVIAVTKADLVDPEWLELISDDIRTLVKGTFLQQAPILPVSSVTGAGLPALIAALDRLATEVEERLAAGPFRLPIDRVFSVPGFGTVVTGTLRSGVAQVGDAAEILPGGKSTRVRSVQVHGEKAEVAGAGSRVALNLVGMEVSDASRGDVVAAAGAFEPTSMVDVRLNLLGEIPRPVKHRSRIRFHTGAAELIGRIALLEGEEAAPGSSVLAQIRLEAPTVVGRGDHFVIRQYSPGQLLGGGIALDPHPRRHRRRGAAVLEALRIRERGAPEDLLAQALLAAGPVSLSTEEVATRSSLDRNEALRLLQTLSRAENTADRKTVTAVGPRWTHTDQLEAIENQALALLSDYHRRNPLQPGMPREELRARAGRNLDPRVYNLALNRLEEASKVIQDAGLVRRSEHEVRLEGRLAELADAVLELYRQAAFNPPSADEGLARVASTSSDRETVRIAVEVLLSRGDLVKIAEGLYLEWSVLEQAIARAREMLGAQGSMTISQFRDAIGSSRKVVVPLMEYLDSARVTRRRGDERVLY